MKIQSIYESVKDLESQKNYTDQDKFLSKVAKLDFHSYSDFMIESFTEELKARAYILCQGPSLNKEIYINYFQSINDVCSVRDSVEVKINQFINLIIAKILKLVITM